MVKKDNVRPKVIHYKNPRIDNMTVCGHNCTVPGRTYSNVTSNPEEVTCYGCINNMRHYKGVYKQKKEKKKVKGYTSKGLRRDTLNRDRNRDRKTLMTDKKADNNFGLRYRRRDILHFRNPRIPNHTLCGHNCTIPGRAYSNVTKRIDEVTCSTCLNAIRNSKWLREMIENIKRAENFKDNV